MRKLFLPLFLCAICTASAQMPSQWNSSEIFQKIEKLNVLGNVLYIAAHPDDENQRFITYCANEKLYNSAYMSLTRGDGGQNLIGTEIREELGIIRTQELLAARRTDGGKQFFSRANDFGYSKTPEETLSIWDRDKVLADVVWVIRKFRPDVIVCRFPINGGGGHGHHTASAILAKEAFALSNNKSIYPEQLQYVDPWQPKRVVINTGRWWNDTISAEDPGVVVHDIGLYNQMLGTSYNELAARSRSNHKCQGFGATGSRGDYEEFFEHLVGEPANETLFDGYPSDWTRVGGSAAVNAMCDKLARDFDISNPGASVDGLLQLRSEINKLRDEHWKTIKLNEIDELLLQCSGIYIEAVADEYSKTSGDSLKVNFEMINRSDVKVKVKNLKNADLVLDENLESVLLNNEKVEVERGFVMPNIAISQPYWLAEEVTMGYNKVSDQALRGKAENDPTIMFDVKLDFNGTEIDYRYPLIYKWNDPVDGESYRPFIVAPAVTVNIDQPIILFSDQNSQEIVLTLTANKDNESGVVEIKSPKGWEITHARSYDLAKKGDELKVRVNVTPRVGVLNGQMSVWLNGESALAMNTIEYDHIPTQVWFPEAKSQLVFVDLKKTGKKIGYVMGAGDVVPDALRNIGYEVDVLEEGSVDPGNLKQYDAILVGIRYFNMNERSPYVIPKLLEYVKQGGNLIVQYNTRHRMKTQEFGPYPITLSRERVTEEDAQVRFLNKTHPILNSPNKLTEADFDNWVQERGLYFPNEWDDKYETILSWNDKGETPKDGSLLVTKYGDGNYIYSGISFFRELPAGVPGAYRLLVNMISLGQ